jgi:hypothetical protein
MMLQSNITPPLPYKRAHAHTHAHAHAHTHTQIYKKKLHHLSLQGKKQILIENYNFYLTILFMGACGSVVG